MELPDSVDVLEELARLPTVAHPTVSPDGDRVALYYDATGRNELHVLDPTTGDLRQVSDGEVPRNARWPVEWSADGDRLFFHLDDAGVAAVGVTDLRDMYENTMPHFRTGLMERYLGTPEENPELYDERSPVNYAGNLDAPLLVLHGVNDRRVPVSQSRLFRDALDEHGVEAGEDGTYEYVELGEEGHGSSDIDQKIRWLRALDDFLARRLGRPAVTGADD